MRTQTDFGNDTRQDPSGLKSPAGKQFFPQILVEQRFSEKIGVAGYRRNRFRLERQVKDEGRAAAGLAASFDFSTVMVHNKKRSHQVNAILGWHVTAHNKRVEDCAQCALRKSRPVVADLNDHFLFWVILQFRRQRDAAAGGQYGQFFLEQ